MHNQVLLRNSGKKCDKTMKSTLFIRAPMIAACPSFLASSGFTAQIIKFHFNKNEEQFIFQMVPYVKDIGVSKSVVSAYTVHLRGLSHST